MYNSCMVNVYTVKAEYILTIHLLYTNYIENEHERLQWVLTIKYIKCICIVRKM